MQYGACNIPGAFIILTARGRLGREHGNAIVTHTGRDRIALRCPIRLPAVCRKGFVSFVRRRESRRANTLPSGSFRDRVAITAASIVVPLLPREIPLRSPISVEFLFSLILPLPPFSLPQALLRERSSEWPTYKKKQIGSATVLQIS